MDVHIQMTAPFLIWFQLSLWWMGDLYLHNSRFTFHFSVSRLKRPRGASGRSKCCSTGGHGGAAKENSDEGKFIPCHLASPSATIQEFPVSHMTSGFFHSMMRAAVGIWSKLSRGRRRLLSSAVVDMPTRTTPPNWHHMSARNTAPCAALWYVQVHPVSLGAYWCPLLNCLQLYNNMLRVTSFFIIVLLHMWVSWGLWLVHSGIWYWPYLKKKKKNNVNSQAK